MAKYTVELNDIVKSGINIFNFNYDFYDPAKKQDFERMFINHFRFREICTETVGRWLYYLVDKFDTVLPLYNEMLKVAQMDYDLINNYNLTETFAKTSTATKATTADTSNTLNRTTEAMQTGEKTNTLDSDTSHTENNTFTRTEAQTEGSATTEGNKAVESNTPSALLTMADIKNNVYASKANIEDNTTATSANKTNNTTETTNNNVNDKVNAESHDSTTDTHDESVNETNAGTATQNETGNGAESYKLERVGNIGVDAPSDMLRKHIEFQKTIRTVYTQFFNECEDLFMQVY